LLRHYIPRVPGCLEFEELLAVGERLVGDYDTAVQELSAKNDKTAKASKAMATAGLLKPAAAVAPPPGFPNRRTGPATPDGFA